jgi:hypothetical protein
VKEFNHLWGKQLTEQLKELSAAAQTLSIHISSDDLKHRCIVLSRGANTAIDLLPRVCTEMSRQSSTSPEADEVSAYSDTGAIETKLLYKLGWLAMELGLEDDGLAVLDAVGTLLHGKLGGAVFRIEALLAIGRPKEAAELYKSETSIEDDVESLAGAIFTMLWNQRGDALWAGLKTRSNSKCKETEPALVI